VSEKFACPYTHDKHVGLRKIRQLREIELEELREPGLERDVLNVARGAIQIITSRRLKALMIAVTALRRAGASPRV